MEYLYLTEEQVDQLAKEYFQDNAKKIRTIIDNIINKLSGIYQKDLDDFYSIGEEIFLQALCTFNGKGTFNGYLAMILKKKIYSYVSTRNRKKRMNQISHKQPDGRETIEYLRDISLEEIIEWDDKGKGCLYDILGSIDRHIDQPEEYSEKVICYLHSLPRKTKKIAVWISEGIEEDIICRRLGITRGEYKIHIGIMQNLEYTKHLF